MPYLSRRRRYKFVGTKNGSNFEEIDKVICYVKNHNLGFEIPYTINGEQHNYIPDFIVKLTMEMDRDNPLNLILEVTGEKKKDKEAKVETAKTLWVPSVNNQDSFGRWGFIEIRDPWNAMQEILSGLK